MNLSELPLIEKIEFQELSFQHEGHDPILNNSSVIFQPHHTYRIQSIEGSGKSTLLQILAGLLIPQSGKILFNDIDMTELNFEEFLPYRLRIGYTFDYGGLINNRTIYDNLVLPLVYHKLFSPTEAKEIVNSYLKKFRIERFANERPAHVPGRVRKLAIILRALVLEPHILLLDDPSVGLGEETQKVLVEHIMLAREEGTLPYVFVASYDDYFLNRLPHDTIHLDGGNIYWDRTAAKVVNL